MAWSVVSKVVDKSSKTEMEYSPLSARIRMSLVTLSSAVSLTEARLKFIRDIVSLNQLEKLLRDNFFNNLGNEGKFGNG